MLDGSLSRLFITGNTDALTNFDANQGSLMTRGGRLFGTAGDFGNSGLVRVVNGDLVLSGGTVTIEALVGELPPPMGREHVLINVLGGVIEGSDLPEFSLILPRAGPVTACTSPIRRSC